MSKQKKAPERKPAKSQIVSGILDISRSGMGFVKVEGYDQDIMVKPNDFGKAFDGDIVKVEIPHHHGNGRIEGKITDVIKRSKTEFVGNIEINKNIAFFVASAQKVPDARCILLQDSSFTNFK